MYKHRKSAAYALKDIFPESLNEKKPHSRQDAMVLGQSVQLPSSRTLGSSSILPSVPTPVEKKVPPLFSSLAALPGRVSSLKGWAGGGSLCQEPGGCRVGGCVGSYWPLCSAFLSERGDWGNWGQGANEAEAKGFLLQSNSIRSILMETHFVTPTQAAMTKRVYMTCCHITSQGSSPWFPAGLQ